MFGGDGDAQGFAFTDEVRLANEMVQIGGAKAGSEGFGVYWGHIISVIQEYKKGKKKQSNGDCIGIKKVMAMN